MNSEQVFKKSIFELRKKKKFMFSNERRLCNIDTFFRLVKYILLYCGYKFHHCTSVHDLKKNYMYDFIKTNILKHKYLLLVHDKHNDNTFFLMIGPNHTLFYKTEPSINFILLTNRWGIYFAPKIKWSHYYRYKFFTDETGLNNYIKVGNKVSKCLNNLKPIFNFILDRTLFNISLNSFIRSRHLFQKKHIDNLSQDIRKLIY